MFELQKFAKFKQNHLFSSAGWQTIFNSIILGVIVARPMLDMFDLLWFQSCMLEVKLHLIRKVVSVEYCSSIKKEFPRRYSKSYHIIIIANLSNKPFAKKFPQIGIFYLVPDSTFVDGLLVDSCKLKFHVTNPILAHLS